MSKILLIAATTGYQTYSLNKAATGLNVEVTLATDRCHVLENPWSDNAIAVRFDEPSESADTLAETAVSRGIDAIAAVGDRPTVLAAMTAERLEIAWHPVSATLRCRGKHQMRERFRGDGLLVPRYMLIGHEGAPDGDRVEFPCVLKPLHLSGSRGVIRADHRAEFDAALERVRAIAGHKRAPVQVEEYIPGSEFALEGLMSVGELRVLAIFDKPDPLTGPYFEETIYVTPSREPSEIQMAIVETTRRAVRALGLWHGPIHAEMRVNAAGVWMLEIAARPIGGLCARALRFRAPGFGEPITLEQLVVLHAIGRMPKALEPAVPASGVMMIPVPRQGILAGVRGIQNAREVECIDDVIITAKQGEKLIPLPEGSSYPGFVFASGPDPEIVESALRQAHARLHFEILADLTVNS